MAWPAAEFPTFRADVEGSYIATIDLVPALAERVRQGQRAERISGSGEMPNYYRKPSGPGWALVGDAGYLKDPISAYGISDAFRDAELLTAALDDGFTGRQPLSYYRNARNDKDCGEQSRSCTPETNHGLITRGRRTKGNRTQRSRRSVPQPGFRALQPV